MPEILKDIRPYLELAYFAAGIILAFGLWFAYRQLKLIQEDMLIRSRRAASEKALEATLRYFEQYVPKSGALFKARNDKNIPPYKGSIGDFSFESLTEEQKTVIAKQATLVEGLPTLNELEFISAFFVSGVADEETGFRIIGRTFCSTVETHYGLIALFRRHKAQAYWSNIVDLYHLWRPRLTIAELQMASKELEQKMNILNQINNKITRPNA
jgi:hypothetical protein